jgi:hypothetical protein
LICEKNCIFFGADSKDVAAADVCFYNNGREIWGCCITVKKYKKYDL